MAETGVYKLENGFWAYRFIIKVNVYWSSKIVMALPLFKQL